MAKNFDDLIDHLLEEIALCGAPGVQPSDILRFIDDFYKGSDNAGVGNHDEELDSTRYPPKRLSVDRALQETVWKWLAGHPEIRIGLRNEGKHLTLSEVEAFYKDDESQQSGVKPASNPEQVGQEYLTKHERFKATHKSVRDECGEQRDEAIETSFVRGSEQVPKKCTKKIPDSKKNSRIRVFTTEERNWMALTGHAPDLSRVLSMDFVLLSIIGSQRHAGILQPNLCQVSGQDQRSVPGRVQRMRNNGYVEIRKAVGNGMATSVLYLKRYAPRAQMIVNVPDVPGYGNDSPGPEDIMIDHGALTENLFNILREFNLITFNDLKRKLGVFGSRWLSKRVAIAVRQFELHGFLRRVGAPAKVGGHIYKCVQFLREPKKQDLKSFENECPIPRIPASREEDAEVDGERDEDYQSITDIFMPLEGIQGTTRIVPQWTPDRCTTNLFRELIHSSGTRGISTMAIKEHGFGDFSRRPQECLLTKLTEVWYVSQPAYLRHLAIIRDTTCQGRSKNYIHYSFENFQRLVAENHTSWEAIMQGPKNGIEDPLAFLEEKLDVDQYGFLLLPNSLFEGQSNSSTLRESAHGSNVPEFPLTRHDPREIVLEDGSPSIVWKQHVSIKQRSAMSLFSGDELLPTKRPQPPRQPKSRPPKDLGPTASKIKEKRTRNALGRPPKLPGKDLPHDLDQMTQNELRQLKSSRRRAMNYQVRTGIARRVTDGQDADRAQEDVAIELKESTDKYFKNQAIILHALQKFKKLPATRKRKATVNENVAAPLSVYMSSMATHNFPHVAIPNDTEKPVASALSAPRKAKQPAARAAAEIVTFPFIGQAPDLAELSSFAAMDCSTPSSAKEAPKYLVPLAINASTPSKDKRVTVSRRDLASAPRKKTATQGIVKDITPMPLAVASYLPSMVAHTTFSLPSSVLSTERSGSFKAISINESKTTKSPQPIKNTKFQYLSSMYAHTQPTLAITNTTIVKSRRGKEDGSIQVAGKRVPAKPRASKRMHQEVSSPNITAPVTETGFTMTSPFSLVAAEISTGWIAGEDALPSGVAQSNAVPTPQNTLVPSIAVPPLQTLNPLSYCEGDLHRSLTNIPILHQDLPKSTYTENIATAPITSRKRSKVHEGTQTLPSADSPVPRKKRKYPSKVLPVEPVGRDHITVSSEIHLSSTVTHIKPLFTYNSQNASAQAGSSTEHMTKWTGGYPMTYNEQRQALGSLQGVGIFAGLKTTLKRASRGRSKKSRMLIFKSARLKDFAWFVENGPMAPAATAGQAFTLIQASENTEVPKCPEPQDSAEIIRSPESLKILQALDSADPLRAAVVSTFPKLPKAATIIPLPEPSRTAEMQTSQEPHNIAPRVQAESKSHVLQSKSTKTLGMRRRSSTVSDPGDRVVSAGAEGPRLIHHNANSNIKLHQDTIEILSSSPYHVLEQGSTQMAYGNKSERHLISSSPLVKPSKGPQGSSTNDKQSNLIGDYHELLQVQAKASVSKTPYPSPNNLVGPASNHSGSALEEIAKKRKEPSIILSQSELIKTATAILMKKRRISPLDGLNLNSPMSFTPQNRVSSNVALSEQKYSISTGGSLTKSHPISSAGEEIRATQLPGQEALPLVAEPLMDAMVISEPTEPKTQDETPINIANLGVSARANDSNVSIQTDSDVDLGLVLALETISTAQEDLPPTTAKPGSLFMANTSHVSTHSGSKVDSVPRSAWETIPIIQGEMSVPVEDVVDHSLDSKDHAIKDGKISKAQTASATSGPSGKMIVAGGTINFKRKKIILDILHKCGGVFPGDRELWYPFATAWQAQGNASKPDEKTIKSAKKALIDVGRIRQLKFSFIDKCGATITKKMITAAGIHPTDAKVHDLQKKMIERHPKIYIPEEVEVSDTLKPHDTVVAIDPAVDKQAVVRLHYVSPYVKRLAERKAATAHRRQERLLKQQEKAYRRQAMIEAALDEELGEPDFMIEGYQDRERVMTSERDGLVRFRARSPGTLARMGRKSIARRLAQTGKLSGPTHSQTDCSSGDHTLSTAGTREKYSQQSDMPVLFSNAGYARPVRFANPLGLHSKFDSEMEYSQEEEIDEQEPLEVDQVWRDFSMMMLPPFSIGSLSSESFTESSKNSSLAGTDIIVDTGESREFEHASPLQFNPLYEQQYISTLMDPDHVFHAATGTFSTKFLVLRNARLDLWVTPPSDPSVAMLPYTLYDLLCRQRDLVQPEKTVDIYSRTQRIARQALQSDFEIEVDKVFDWELKTEGLCASKSADWRFINHHMPHGHIRAGYVTIDMDVVNGGRDIGPASSHYFGRRVHGNYTVSRPIKRLKSRVASEAVAFSSVPTKRRLPDPRIRRLTSVAQKASVSDRLDGTLSIDSDGRIFKRRRSRGTTEKFGPENEKRLMVTVCAIRVLTGGLNRVIDWTLVARLFGPEFGEGYVLKCWQNIIRGSKYQMDKLESDFRELFIQSYEKSEIPSIDFGDLENYDWKKLVDWAQERLGDPEAKIPTSRYWDAKKSAEDLVDLSRYNAHYHLRELPESDFQDFYGRTLAQGQYASFKRIDVLSRRAFVEPLQPPLDPATKSEDARYLALLRTWVRANVITPADDYSPDLARLRFMSLPLPTRRLERLTNRAVHELLKSHVLMEENKGRLIPGRNYDVTHAFLKGLRKTIDVGTFKRATLFKLQLDAAFTENGAMDYSHIAADGDTLVILNLQANGRIKLVPRDVPMNIFGLHEGNYKSRFMNKDKLNFSIEIRPTPTYIYGHPLHSLPNPPNQHLGKDEARIPIWYDIFDHVVPVLWEMVLAATMALIATRPGIIVRELVNSMNPGVEEWEMEVLMEWCEKAGLVKRRGSGWVTDEWWWSCFGVE